MRGRGDRGASAVELAVVLPMCLTLAIGAAEMGFAMRDWMSVTSAAREGARVGSAAGNHSDADCRVLEAVGAALVSVPIEGIDEVWIFKAGLDGQPEGPQQVYRPATGDPFEILVCGGGWADWTGGSPWPPEDRETDPTEELDKLGVRVFFGHEWLTNFVFTGTAEWTDDAVMRLEPQVEG